MTKQQLEGVDQVVIWQAQGMLMELFGCKPYEADVWLWWRARVDQRTVAEAAVQLVTRSTAATIACSSLSREREEPRGRVGDGTSGVLCYGDSVWGVA